MLIGSRHDSPGFLRGHKSYLKSKWKDQRRALVHQL